MLSKKTNAGAFLCTEKCPSFRFFGDFRTTIFFSIFTDLWLCSLDKKNATDLAGLAVVGRPIEGMTHLLSDTTPPFMDH